MDSLEKSCKELASAIKAFEAIYNTKSRPQTIAASPATLHDEAERLLRSTSQALSDPRANALYLRAKLLEGMYKMRGHTPHLYEAADRWNIPTEIFMGKGDAHPSIRTWCGLLALNRGIALYHTGETYGHQEATAPLKEALGLLTEKHVPGWRATAFVYLVALKPDTINNRLMLADAKIHLPTRPDGDLLNLWLGDGVQPVGQRRHPCRGLWWFWPFPMPRVRLDCWRDMFHYQRRVFSL